MDNIAVLQEILTTNTHRMGVDLTSEQLEQFCQYADLLVEWNQKMNLTAITDPEGIAVKHFADSLCAWKVIDSVRKEKPDRRISLIDVGTGAGFPGIPLKILFPDLKVVLLDSLQKRLTFLETVIHVLGLSDIRCVHDRAEEGAHRPKMREQFDMVTARAVASLPVLLEYCAGYAKVGGYFLAYKGPSLGEELSQSKRAQKVLKMDLKEVLKDQTGSDQHQVAVFVKGGPLALQYPRKQSKIKSTPLTGE